MKSNAGVETKRLFVNVARMKRYGINFEVPINPDEAVALRQGKNVDIKDCIISQDIFTDTKKGMKAPEMKFMEAFGTTDTLEIAKILITKGELQTSEEFRDRLREDKRKNIISQISRYAIDPTTKLPHPPQRIERAMAEAKVKIDENHSAEDQIQKIVHMLKPIIPIKLEVQHIEIVVPAKYAPKAAGLLKQYPMEKEEWQPNGDLYTIIHIPAGLVEEMYEKLNRMTHGAITSKVIKTD